MASRLMAFTTGGTLSLLAYLAFLACTSSNGSPPAVGKAGLCEACNGSNDCAVPLACAAGSCRASCTLPKDCPSGNCVNGSCACGASKMICERCQQTDDCIGGVERPPTVVCSGETGYCQPNHLCQSSADCRGLPCDNGLCICVPPDAGNSDSGDAGVAETTGEVDVSFTANATYFSAAFQTITAYTTTITPINGTVRVLTFSGNLLASPQALDAGTLTFTGGSSTVTMAPPYNQTVSNGLYADVGRPITLGWAGGHDIGAGMASAKVPGSTVWGSPASPDGGATMTIASNTDFVMTWAAGTALPTATVHFRLVDAGSTTTSHWIVGDFQVSAGTGTIPAAAFGPVSKGSVVVQIWVQDTSTTVVGGVPVTFTVIAPSGFLAPGGANLQ